MNRKSARFDVVGIEVMVHCPHCESPALSPLDATSFVWNAAAVQHQGSQDAKCSKCRRWFRTSYELRKLLLPRGEPVHHDQRVGPGALEIICGNCAGDETVPVKTLLASNRRCATCGGDNYTLAAHLQSNANSNGKEISE
jgi:Zn finger protein HypA/HybF involved in hydrogenase expression